MHGGKTPIAGPTHPRYSTGRYSKHLPPAVAARVAESFADPNLLSVRSQAALLDARCTMLMERLHTGESGTLWALLNDSWQLFTESEKGIQECKKKMQAISADDPDGDTAMRKLQEKIHQLRQQTIDAMGEVGRLISQGHKDEASWRELIDHSHELVLMKQAEMDRLAKLRQMMTAEEVLAMVIGLQHVIVEVLTDENVRTKDAARLKLEIGHGLARLMPSSDTSAAVSPAATIPAAEIIQAGPAPQESPSPAGRKKRRIVAAGSNTAVSNMTDSNTIDGHATESPAPPAPLEDQSDGGGI